MRMKMFRVQGFANLTGPVQFGPLEEVNLVYGPNNTGKSNLLRAIELYFRLLGVGEAVTKTQGLVIDNPEPDLRTLLESSFNEADPKPISFHAEWTIPDEEMEKWSLFPEAPCNHVETVLELNPMNRAYELRIKRWMMGDKDVGALDRTKEPTLVGFTQQIRRLLADARPFQQEKPILPYRRFTGSSEGFPQALRDGLFDARLSTSAEARVRWAVFARVTGELKTELGEGSWETTFDRPAGRADVIYLGAKESRSLDRMGTGARQCAALLAELALAEERYVCLEEPEWRLAPALQRRFVELARQIIQSGVGPRQLFITTHSPTLAAQGAAFALRHEGTTPVLELKPWAAEGEPVSVPPNGADSGPGTFAGAVERLAPVQPA